MHNVLLPIIRFQNFLFFDDIMSNTIVMMLRIERSKFYKFTNLAVSTFSENWQNN